MLTKPTGVFCLTLMCGLLYAQDAQRSEAGAAGDTGGLDAVNQAVERQPTREEVRARGVEFRKQFFGDTLSRATAIPDYGPLSDELDFGIIRAREGLSMAQKALVGLTAVSATQQYEAIPDLTRAALNAGLEPRSILEIFLQTSLYTGFSTAQPAAAQARLVFADLGLDVDDDVLPFEDYETLEREYSRIHDPIHRGIPAAPETTFVSRLLSPLRLYAYGVLFRRPGLTERQRMTIFVASQTAFGGMEASLPLVFRAGLNVGITIDELAEIIIQTAPYSGTWRAAKALMVMEQVFPDGEVLE